MIKIILSFNFSFYFIFFLFAAREKTIDKNLLGLHVLRLPRSASQCCLKRNSEFSSTHTIRSVAEFCVPVGQTNRWMDEAYACEAAQTYSCNIRAGKLFEWKCYTNSDVWRCVNPRHRYTYETHAVQLKRTIFWFWDFDFIKIITYCVEKMNLFFIPHNSRQLSRFHTWLNSNQLTDWNLLYVHKNMNWFFLWPSIAIIWCNIGQVHMKYAMILDLIFVFP